MAGDRDEEVWEMTRRGECMIYEWISDREWLVFIAGSGNSSIRLGKAMSATWAIDALRSPTDQSAVTFHTAGGFKRHHSERYCFKLYRDAMVILEQKYRATAFDIERVWVIKEISSLQKSVMAGALLDRFQ